MINEEIFPFLAGKGHIVSLVGGGGKTTLLYAMAEYCARHGWKTLVTTTTHILQPDRAVWAQTDAQLSTLWNRGGYAVLGSEAANGKLTAPSPALLDRWLPHAEAVFIEADGAKHLPCKVPAAHEPVLLPQSDLVLAVAGLSALGRPLAEVCFRPEIACGLLAAEPDTLLTPQLLAAMLASEWGGRKNVGKKQFYAVLNQADTPDRQNLGRQTLAVLSRAYQVKGFMTAFQEGERA